MSDAGDEVQVDDAPAEVEVSEAPKGKMTVEDALKVTTSPIIMLQCGSDSFVTCSKS